MKIGGNVGGPLIVGRFIADRMGYLAVRGKHRSRGTPERRQGTAGSCCLATRWFSLWENAHELFSHGVTMRPVRGFARARFDRRGGTTNLP